MADQNNIDRILRLVMDDSMEADDAGAVGTLETALSTTLSTTLSTEMMPSVPPPSVPPPSIPRPPPVPRPHKAERRKELMTPFGWYQQLPELGIYPHKEEHLAVWSDFGTLKNRQLEIRQTLPNLARRSFFLSDTRVWTEGRQVGTGSSECDGRRR